MDERYWKDKKRLKDPMFWFMKAYQFSSNAELLIEELPKYKGQEIFNMPKKLFNAISTIPYLVAQSCELFMKGYLVYNKVEASRLRRVDIGHNLKKLREMCLGFGDIRFNNDHLIFVTDTLGEHLMDDGGIRYPDKMNMAIYSNEFEKALRSLQEVIGEITNLLVKPSEGMAILYEDK